MWVYGMSVVTVGWYVDRREEKAVSYAKDDIDQNPPCPTSRATRHHAICKRWHEQESV